MIEDAGFIKDIDDSFLRSVSVYVLDMRMLKNIVVEFSIYKNTLIRSLEYLTPTKLFAFIVYKNVYSDDFAKLHEGKGDLFEFLRGLTLSKATQEESANQEGQQAQTEDAKDDVTDVEFEEVKEDDK